MYPYPLCPLQLYSVLKYFTILNFQPLLQKNCFQPRKQNRMHLFTKFSFKIISMNALINIFFLALYPDFPSVHSLKVKENTRLSFPRPCCFCKTRLLSPKTGNLIIVTHQRQNPSQTTYAHIK
jgi:hypothetical protein